jgi:nitrite reductase (NADH) small subunit
VERREKRGVAIDIEEGMTMNWKLICKLDDIIPLGSRRVQRAHGGDVAVFRAGDDHVFALLDRCPHKGGPLSQGIVFGHQVACPLHNWTIGLADGCAQAPDVGCTVSFQVKVDQGQVFLDIDELNTLAVDTPIALPNKAKASV